jgi:hypothetical protein
MVQICPRCQRANPRNAVFCHFDGCLLRQGAAGAAAGQLLQEFIFPSSRRCRTFDELVQGCYHEWEEARQLLSDGTFASFLAGIGRADLAKVAREALAHVDLDIGLTNFVAALPATQVQGPKLGLNPRRMVIGPVRVGETKPARIVVLNEGQALLQGKVTIDSAPWLRFVVGGDGRSCAIKTGREQAINLETWTAGLIAGQAYSAKLVVLTNGGVAEVPIRLDLQARPFPKAPYQGAVDPRDLARKMRDNPKPAVPLLESGEIARWFASNGWAYPIAGACAPGLAAVQQYFEELGLAKAPHIVISDQELRFRCTSPEVATGQVSIKSPARKPVYGRADSDAPWLKVTTPAVSGQGQAHVHFQIDSTLMDEDRAYLGTLKVIANAGQHFEVRVQVDVQGNRKGWFSRSRAAPPEPAPAPPPPPPPAPTPAPAAAPLATWMPSSPAVATAAAPAPAWAGAGAVTAAPPVPPAPSPPAPVVLTPVGRATDGPALFPAPGEAANLTSVVRVGIVQAILVGALLGLIWRLLLVFPADLYARVMANPVKEPPPGSLEAWLQAPPADGVFLRLFVLATWWVGAIAGVILVRRAGGHLGDLICGLLAGAVAGLAGSATAACVLVLGDALPRALMHALMGHHPLGAGGATPLWIITATVSWIIEGAAVGLVLALLGRSGAAVLAFLGAPVAWFLRLFGMGNLADFFSLRGS